MSPKSLEIHDIVDRNLEGLTTADECRNALVLALMALNVNKHYAHHGVDDAIFTNICVAIEAKLRA